MVLLFMSATVAWANGDREYGEYLSSECTACHQPKTDDAGIPSIHRYDSAGFQHIMKLYRSKELANPTMQTVAGRLSDEDIAALAAYYSALSPLE